MIVAAGLCVLVFFASSVLYPWLGHALIKDIYNGTSIPALNHIISGQHVHPVNFYLQIADQFILLANIHFLLMFFVSEHSFIFVS